MLLIHCGLLQIKCAYGLEDYLNMGILTSDFQERTVFFLEYHLKLTKWQFPGRSLAELVKLLLKALSTITSELF